MFSGNQAPWLYVDFVKLPYLNEECCMFWDTEGKLTSWNIDNRNTQAIFRRLFEYENQYNKEKKKKAVQRMRISFI